MIAPDIRCHFKPRPPTPRIHSALHKGGAHAVPTLRDIRLSRRRYGKRVDQRKHALGVALAAISHVASADFLVKSDQCPPYPKLVRQHLPGAKHKTFKGRGRSGRLVRWWLSRQAQSCRAVYEVPCRRYQVQWHTDLKTACHTVFDQRTFPARYNNACRRFIF